MKRIDSSSAIKSQELDDYLYNSKDEEALKPEEVKVKPT